jgi:hypothetical protein
MRYLLPLLAVLCLPLSAVRANDGAISMGGTPRLLSSHKTVSMQSEVIRMTVGEEKITTDCRFVFKNDGPAVTVRMGFPDQGRGDVAGAEENEPPGTPLRGTFITFKSYVDGKPIATKIVKGENVGDYWHVKDVRFPANSTVIIRDVYTQIAGTQITGVNTLLGQASYILHTGASWKGNIGSTEVLVTFQRKRPTLPLEPAVLRREVQDKVLYDTDWSKDSHRVYWRGFAIPTVKGNTLRFYRTNWKPTPRSDIYLAFDNKNLRMNP